MDEKTIQIKLVFSKRQLKGFMVVSLLLGLAYAICSETFTVTTAIPSPAGIYRKLITTAKTTLARDLDTVEMGTPGNAQDKLNVYGKTSFNGDVKIGGNVDMGGKRVVNAAQNPASLLELTTNAYVLGLINNLQNQINILKQQGPTTSTTGLQTRVTGTCTGGSGISGINANGTVSCSPPPSTTGLQSRVTGTCTGGSGINGINANGTVSCSAPTSSSSGGAGCAKNGMTFPDGYTCAYSWEIGKPAKCDSIGQLELFKCVNGSFSSGLSRQPGQCYPMTYTTCPF